MEKLSTAFVLGELGSQGMTFVLSGILCYVRTYYYLFSDIKCVQQKMKEQHEKKLQALQVNSLLLNHSVLWSTDVYVCVAVPDRNRILFRRVFRAHHQL